MSNDQQFVAPDELKSWIFYYAHRFYQSLPGWLRQFIEISVIKLSPDIPIDLSTIFQNPQYRKSFLWSSVSAFFMCFVATALLSYLSGTLVGNDPNRLYFVNDLTDIVEYTIICPAYVAFDVLLIIIVLSNVAEWQKFSNALNPKEPPVQSQSLKTTATITVALIVSSGLTINYIKETLDVSIYPKHFWFVEQVAQSGERILGVIGLYYSFLNFGLLFISVLALLTCFKVFISGIQIGNALSKTDEGSQLTIEELRNRLDTFTKAYIISKILAGLYMLNTFTWNWVRPRGSLNFIIMGAVLTIFGVFFISVPRYYIELQWYQLKIRQAKLEHAVISKVYDDIRPRRIKLLASFLDLSIIGGFAVSFWFNLI